MPPMVFSNRVSSPFEKFMSSSAVFNNTVPLVSVVILSRGHEKAAITALSTFLISDSINRLKTIPLIIEEEVMPPPTILQMRTFSTEKDDRFAPLGIVSTHVCAMSSERKSS